MCCFAILVWSILKFEISGKEEASDRSIAGLKGDEMNIEKEVVSYLATYGNTRETDLISYCSLKVDRSSKDLKKILDRMVIKGKIHRIVHNRLTPPEVYIGLYEFLPATLTEELFEEDARKILLEAQAIVEEKRREKSSGQGNT